MITPIAIGLWLATWILAITAYLSWRGKLRHLQRDEQLAMSRARQKAVKVISQARDQALEIISGAKISANTDKLKLEANLDKISADQLREFQKLISNISKTIESDAVKEIGEFTQALELETVQSQRIVAQQIEQVKAEKLAQLNTQVNAVIEEVVKQIIGKIIPLEEHEKLIIQALEDAKRRHLV